MFKVLSSGLIDSQEVDYAGAGSDSKASKFFDLWFDRVLGQATLTDIIERMPRVGQFCASNIVRLLLSVVIVVTLVTAVAVWIYHSPGHGTSIEQPAHPPEPQ
jgi:hypothetical protein